MCGYRIDYENRNSWLCSVCHVGALRPFIKQYSAARGSPSNVKIKRSFSLNHSKRLITVGCDGSRYNMMGVDLMKTVAHPTSESVEPIVNILANPILGIAIALLDFTLEVFAPPIDAY